MMRKYIVGFLVGAALTFAVQAGAATLLGSTIDAVIQVEVDGENLGQAPVIDGTSYLPVRKLGNAAGYNVEFGEGKATLTSSETEPVATASEQPSIETGDPVATETPTHNFTLETIEIAIKDKEGTIKAQTVLMKQNEGVNPEEDAKWGAKIKGLELELANLIVIKAELEAQQ